MSMRRIVVTSFCAAGLASALVACGTRDKKPAAPMASYEGVRIALAANYGFMSLQFQLGAVRSYMNNFADSAKLTAPGYGVLRGRDSIAEKFAGEGKRLGVNEFNRSSVGFQIEGRDVLDSGTYKLVTTLPLAKGTIDATGRYWTRWHYAEDARWLIVSDSLAGGKR